MEGVCILSLLPLLSMARMGYSHHINGMKTTASAVHFLFLMSSVVIVLVMLRRRLIARGYSNELLVGMDIGNYHLSLSLPFGLSSHYAPLPTILPLLLLSPTDPIPTTHPLPPTRVLPHPPLNPFIHTPPHHTGLIRRCTMQKFGGWMIGVCVVAVEVFPLPARSFNCTLPLISCTTMGAEAHLPYFPPQLHKHCLGMMQKAQRWRGRQWESRWMYRCSPRIAPPVSHEAAFGR
uniref:Transmembrane protein n=1 Tax=Echinococcus granulosus TaxID=6210 RepID=U6JED6_ECHGR|nr:hypothetical protein EgrG_000359300 [Echinococcus granulosus]CDS22389.1 hypothetical protein EgrG_000359400 [Echinococcus granulosus]